MERVDLIVRGEFLITDAEAGEGAWISDGAVAIKNGTVVASGEWNHLKGNFTAEEQLVRPDGLVMPGLINAHTHAPMVLFRGMADDLPLKQWLEEHIFPAEANLTPDLIRLGAELACAEMIRGGTTGFVDMYLFEDTIVDVTSEVGMRIWAGEGVFDFPSPSFKSGWDALRETERLYEKWKGDELVEITVDPHTPYTCCRELLEAARDLSLENGMLTVIHLAETEWEDAEIRRLHAGLSPAVYLDSVGLLHNRTLAVHCVVLDQKDIALLAKRGVGIAHCPESNLKLGSGVAPVSAFKDAGIITALGTDGAASNNDLDMLGEMDVAAKLPKGLNQNPELLSASEVLAMATSQAGKALGRSDLGRLLPGCRADLAIIDLNSAHLRPCYNPVSHVVYAAGPGDVQDVMVNGRLLMRDRELLTIDEEKLLERIKIFSKG